VSDGPSESCPCCASKDLLEIGKLPDSQWFAGTHLERPLPGGWLYRCQNCSLKFRNPAQTADVYAQLYDNAVTTTWSEETIRADWDLVSADIDKRFPHGGRVLDFGCYTGGLLAQLGTRYERFGIELNRDAADIASQRIGQSVWSCIDEVGDEIQFDAIIAADVIEHVTNPLLLIRQLATKLSNNGVLIITTGDANNSLWNRFGANWWYCFYPEHIVFASADWLGYVSEAAGVTVVDCETFRYLNLSLPRRILDIVQTYFYGSFPKVFLSLVRLFRMMLGRPDTTSLPGAGLTRDHLFVVLSRAARN